MRELFIIVKSHYLALIFAIIVGLIYGSPYLFFALRDDYQGIPFMQINDEDNYQMRMHEIIDGHPAVGSPNFYEYKNQWPLMPPASEFFYALPALMFKTSLVNILIISKFVLPLTLFLLIYSLFYRLTGGSGSFAGAQPLAVNKINAVAGALLITLGYDFVDYGYMWSILTGARHPGGWLIWGRPVNPIFGAIYLSSFLLCLWSIINQTKHRKIIIAAAGIFFALMVASYFFSWGMALSVLGMLSIIYLFRKNYLAVKNLLGVMISAAVFSSPFFYLAWRNSRSPWYSAAAERAGLTYTHLPVVNKFLLATLAIFIIILIWSAWQKHGSGQKFLWQHWHSFSLTFILGGLWAFNQQVVTGLAIWPPHFVQYSIPISIIVLMLLFYNIIRPKWDKLWVLAMIFLFIAPIAYAAYNNWYVYNYAQAPYVEMQKLAPLFNWINKNTPLDSVILVQEKEYDMARNIPIFTHANVYYSGYKYSLIPNPEERFIHNYFIFLRIRGVKPDKLSAYLAEHKSEVRGIIGTDWYSFSQQSAMYPPNPRIQEVIDSLPGRYKDFYKQNFISQLKKYRLDYILSDGQMPAEVYAQLNSHLDLIFKSENWLLYTFK